MIELLRRLCFSAAALLIVQLQGCAIEIKDAASATPISPSTLKSPSPDESAFERLTQAVGTSDFTYFQFQSNCFDCRRKDIPIEQLLLDANEIPISLESKIRLKQLLKAPPSFIFGVYKSCPTLFPSDALIFKASSPSLTLLIFRTCKIAQVIQGDFYFNLNIDPIFTEITEILPFSKL